MIADIFISIFKYIFMLTFAFGLSVMLIAMGGMIYGGIVETIKTERTQSQ
jgi:hypothetical protein